MKQKTSKTLEKTFSLILAMSAFVLTPGTGFAQTLKVTLLGTGNPRPVMSRFGPSILVEAGNEKLLFDCGRGSTQRLYQLKVELSDVTALFLNAPALGPRRRRSGFLADGLGDGEEKSASSLGPGGHQGDDGALGGSVCIRHTNTARR